jgi:hypothetical protein
MAQLSFAELIERRVSLSAAEAVALVLAVAALLDEDRGCGSSAMPSDEEIFLSSTGQVAFVTARSDVTTSDTAVGLAVLLHRLLRLDEPDDGDRRARVPGGLLVVLARTLRRIDLPPLTPEAFRDALTRFTAGTDSAALAAAFWRAARMRPQKGRNKVAAGWACRHRRVERRLNGPTSTDLRRWLRQSERDLFTLRQALPLRASRAVLNLVRSSRPAAAAAGILAAAVIVGVLGIGASRLMQPETTTEPQRVQAIKVDTASVGARKAEAVVRVAAAAGPGQKRSTIGNARRRASAKTPSRRASTVHQRQPRTTRSVYLVNLPRSTWAVTR